MRSYETGTTYSWWRSEEAIRRRLWLRRLRLLQRHVRAGRLLDISTGDGHFLSVGAEAGFEVDGTEFSREGARLCEERGFQVLVTDVESLPSGLPPYDVITLWHVLEHLPRPGAALQKIHALLRPGGILALAVPNESHLLRGRITPETEPFGRIAWGEEIHLTHFVPASLRAALLLAGFEVREMGVDDVEVRPTPFTRLGRLGHQVLNRFCGWHFSKAMYALARKPLASP